MKSSLSLVTGANGHLGYNLVKALISEGHRVRAGVRNVENAKSLQLLNCEIVQADMLNEKAMEKALDDVDVLYHVAAVFKHWAKDPQSQIIEPNIQGTETVLRAAAKADVRKVVYVSSVAAIGHDGTPLDENTWNKPSHNPYYSSKILSERKAWKLAKRYNLKMVAVLPSAIVGPIGNRPTDTMRFLESVIAHQLPINPNFYFNFVDVRDVTKGMIAAAEKGKVGERYILANAHSSSLEEVIRALDTSNTSPRVPIKLPKWMLYIIAWSSEALAKLTDKPAELTRSQVSLFYGVKQEYNIAKAQQELGFMPVSPEVALRSYSKQRQ